MLAPGACNVTVPWIWPVTANGIGSVLATWTSLATVAFWTMSTSVSVPSDGSNWLICSDCGASVEFGPKTRSCSWVAGAVLIV